MIVRLQAQGAFWKAGKMFEPTESVIERQKHRHGFAKSWATRSGFVSNNNKTCWKIELQISWIIRSGYHQVNGDERKGKDKLPRKNKKTYWQQSRSNILRLQCTYSTIPRASGRPHGSPLMWTCQWPSSQPLSSQLSHNYSLWA